MRVFGHRSKQRLAVYFTETEAARLRAEAAANDIDHLGTYVRELILSSLDEQPARVKDGLGRLSVRVLVNVTIEEWRTLRTLTKRRPGEMAPYLRRLAIHAFEIETSEMPKEKGTCYTNHAVAVG